MSAMWTKIYDKCVKSFALIVDAIEKAEKELGDGKGVDKRKLAIKIVNEIVDIPFVPETIEAWIIGLLVDFAVYLYNKWWGHRWLENRKVKES